ncbi:MAG: hypothetical protein Kow0059_07760 [Candidatus Sumerlaeia bacterium]
MSSFTRQVVIWNRPIRAVFLDAAQTLFDLKPSYAGAFAQVCRDFGYQVSEASVAAAVTELEGRERARIRRREGLRVSVEGLYARWVALNRFIFERVGVNGDAEALACEMERRFDSGRYAQVYPDVFPALRELRALGWRLGIISNGTAGMKGCLEHIGLTEGMDCVIISALVGWEKPAREIFEEALRQTGLAAEETVFVGDHFWCDVQGALEVGMRAVWLVRSGVFPPDLPEGAPPCPVIKSLAELAPLLTGRR